MSRLIDVVDLVDSKGYPIGRRLKYACDICGRGTYRSIRMDKKRVLCFECRNNSLKEKRLKNKAVTLSE